MISDTDSNSFHILFDYMETRKDLMQNAGNGLTWASYSHTNHVCWFDATQSLYNGQNIPNTAICTFQVMADAGFMIGHSVIFLTLE